MIIKPLHPWDAPLSSFYRCGSTEPRKGNLSRSQEQVTEPRRDPQHQQLSQHLRSPLPMMPTHRNPREVLIAHFPGGLLCPLILLLSLLMTVSLNPNFSKARWRPPGELGTLCISHFTPKVFSPYSEVMHDSTEAVSRARYRSCAFILHWA